MVFFLIELLTYQNNFHTIMIIWIYGKRLYTWTKDKLKCAGARVFVTIAIFFSPHIIGNYDRRLSSLHKTNSSLRSTISDTKSFQLMLAQTWTNPNNNSTIHYFTKRHCLCTINPSETPLFFSQSKKSSGKIK